MENRPLLINKLFLAFTQFPVVLGWWLWWEPAKARPVLALILSAFYELTMFVFAFGRKVWDKLEERAVQHVSNWIWTSINQFAPGFRRRYKKQILNDYGIFNVRGLGLMSTYSLPLEHVFVDLRIVTSNPQKFNIDLLAQTEAESSGPIWHYLRSRDSKPLTAFDVLNSLPNRNHATALNKALVIVGPPGSGKTTLLQHIALTFASNRQSHFGVSGSTPILLFLRDHVKEITDNKPPSLGSLLYAYFSQSDRFPGLNTPSNWFDKELRRGRCTVLFDGLDEVAGLNQRQLISNWVDEQVKNYPASRFVLSARPQGYRDAPLMRAHILEVQPFTREQVQRFIGNWYLANEIMASGGALDETVRRRASKDATDLFRRLRMSPSLSALTVNPLLLTMISMVHRYQGSLPETRVELYAEICEVLLGRWRQTKGVQETLTAAHKLSVLRPLAAKMMELKLRDISTNEAMGVISAPLKRLGLTYKAAEEFLSDLQRTSGLILEREADHWSFAHLTFQEYLTASQWHKQNINCPWVQMVGDSWWHETLRLYAAQGDATSLVRTCLETDTLPSLILAAECLDERCEIELSVRHAVETRVIADLESSHAARRRFATEVQLSRRLKSLQPIDDEVEIDLNYITGAEYQLFKDETAQPHRYFAGDHASERVFAIGEALKPISGVRAVDAAAFCAWLSQRSGNGFWFRLPSDNEAREYPAQVSDFAAWCKKDNNFVLVGLPANHEAAILQHLRTMSSLPLPNTIEALDFSQFLEESLKAIRRSRRSRQGRLLQTLEPFIELAHDLEKDGHLNTDHDRARFQELSRNLILNLALKIDAELSEIGIQEINSVIAALDRGEMVEARLIAESCMGHPMVSVKSSSKFLYELLTVVTHVQPATSSSVRKIICKMIEYIDVKEPKAVKPFLGLYWRCQIVAARERGDLKAWESIRIVRQQIN